MCSSWRPPYAHEIAAKRQEDGVPKLGLAIFRCTYEDDSAWSFFMDILRKQCRDRLESYGAPHLEALLDWVVFDDKTLEGASIAEVHGRFQAWAIEQVVKDGVHEYCDNVRYHYCVQVDAEALDSIINPPNPHPEVGIDIDKSYVNVIEADRNLISERPVLHMRVALFVLFPAFYHLLQEGIDWDGYYTEPPEIWDG